MNIQHQVVVFDAADLGAESAFWAGVLDGVVDVDDDWQLVIVDGQFRVGVQLAPEHVALDWPGGEPKQQINLDLWVHDFAVAHEQVMSLGATVLWRPESFDSAEGFQVYSDPAHPFCLCWGTHTEDAIRQHADQLRTTRTELETYPSPHNGPRSKGSSRLIRRAAVPPGTATAPRAIPYKCPSAVVPMERTGSELVA